MCYLIAKDKNGHGCYALKTAHGKALVELKRKLNKTAVPKGIQLVTISRPNAYGEYAPTTLWQTKLSLPGLSRIYAIDFSPLESTTRTSCGAFLFSAAFSVANMPLRV